ncbi:MAG: hypothetical protein KKB21_01510 [Nanoarchaeota archaeon]|nr:hypothetical protein [Nanoarchaeota archaeon]MBU4086233.1 hypothetical protein [Nanoarchaeota archaeon]
MKSFLAGIAISLSLAGCSFEGEIVRKIHEPESRRVEMRNLALSDGNRVFRGRIPILYIDDEDNIIDVRGRNEERRFYIKDNNVWNLLRAGQRFKYDSETSEESDPTLMRRMSEGEWREYNGH